MDRWGKAEETCEAKGHRHEPPTGGLVTQVYEYPYSYPDESYPGCDLQRTW